MDQNISLRRFSILAVGLTSLLHTGLMLFAWLDPGGFNLLLAKDGLNEKTGAIEHLTVIVLMPGIVSGLYVFWTYHNRSGPASLRYWILAWSLACIYFAGEEASWGQWYFNWQTPDILNTFNDQGETNIHNISSWLDQKPQACVELFIFFAGFLIPLYRILADNNPLLRFRFLLSLETWIFAPTSLLPAGLLFVVIRITDYLPQHTRYGQFGNGELREFLIAWFLMLYLISYVVRLKRVPVAGKATLS